MSIRNVTVEAVCNKCGVYSDDIYLQLAPFAARSIVDEVHFQLEGEGWTIVSDAENLCPKCTKILNNAKR